MQFMRAIAVGTAAAFMLANTAAQATMVQPITGEVMINQGQGYQTIKNPIEAKAGDRVIVNPGGYAKVKYSDGCNIPIQPGAVAIIGAQSPCIAQAQQVEIVQAEVEPVAGGAAAGAGKGTGTLVAVGLGVAAAVGIGIAASSGGSSKKAASP